MDSKPDFAGKTLYTKTRHKRLSGDAELLTTDTFTYTEQDKLLTHTHQINALTPQLLTKNEYDELGQLIRKSVGGEDVTGAAALQKVDYQYNIRGWLKKINDVDNLQVGTDPQDLFAFKLNYDTAEDPEFGCTSLYNGNISQAYWRTASDNTQRKYGFAYDHLNRLLHASYSKPLASVYNTGSYDEMISYDKNGNITTLYRTGEYDDLAYNLLIDNLTYTYSTTNPNQLTKVADLTTNPNGFKDGTNTDDDYAYDTYGNMTQDKNKGITEIKYNHLNLPVKITFGTTGNIEYLYNAGGVKVRKIVTEGSAVRTTDYLNGFQYINNNMEFFPHAEGYVKKTMASYNYVFNYTDHLGNIRLSYTKNPTTNVLTILEENNYYPFGLKHRNYNMTKKQYEKDEGNIVITPTNLTVYDYKYNGKEWQDELGLNFYDYGARNYDPAIGRWMNIDPLSEDYYEQSPFLYAGNNPLIFVDYDGRDYGVYINHENKSITIKSHYIVNSNDSGLMNEIASYWNELSGNFEYSFDNEGHMDSYVINFEVTVAVDDSIVSSEGSDFLTAGYEKAKEGRKNNPTSNEINSLVTSSDHLSLKKDDKKQGITGGYDVVVRKESRNKKNVGKHEVGHNFGMSHTSHLMNTSAGTNVTSRSVGETLSRVGLGSVKYGDNTGDGAIGSIKDTYGTTPGNFYSGSVEKKKNYEKRKNREIKN